MTAHHDATDTRVRLAALWGSLRLAVLDTETCMATDGDHVIEVAVVTWRAGKQVGAWSSRFSPGVKIDAVTFRTHGLTDEDLVGEPTFADQEPTLTRILAPVDGERLVLVCHNATFDVSRLRLEYERIGRPMPDILVLDTAFLAKQVGVRAASLTQLLSELHLVNAAAHSALGDATATGQAAAAMLAQAATAGERDFDTLLVATMGSAKRTSDIKAPRRKRKPAFSDVEAVAVELPAAHTAGHAELLGPHPTEAELDRWQAAVSECATLRCPYLAARVDVTPANDQAVRMRLEHVLDACLTGADSVGAATVLGALSPMLTALPTRAEALRWYATWEPRLSVIQPCPVDDRCPACSNDQPCPIDTWHHDVAAAALGHLDTSNQLAKTFLHTNGVEEGKGVFTTWRGKGHQRLADYAAWLVHEFWLSTNQLSTAQAFAHYAWAAGGRDPRLVAAHARNVAAPGGVTHLQLGIDVCDQTLPAQANSTDQGWADLRGCRARLAGQLRRATNRLSNQIDDNGNAIPIRRHHPDTPERSRRARFSLAP